MVNSPTLFPAYQRPRLHGNYLLAVLALLALATAVGFWYWNAASKVAHVTIGAGVELKYRGDLVTILGEEAAENDLKTEVRPTYRSTEAVDRVNRGELDAAVIPAGLGIKGDAVRQAALLDCEALHLFVKPQLLADGLAGLHGRSINLGSPGSGVRILAEEVLQFMGMKRGEDCLDGAYTYPELIRLAPEAMPDAIFSLSPLPSPAGEKLVHEYGYQLMELPFGEAMALRKPFIEETRIPADTYGVHPAVPQQPLRTVGTRAVLIANAKVPVATIRRLVEVLYESDFARRAGIQPLDVSLLQRPGEYPNHAGTIAYLHRHDPWINKDLQDNFSRLKGALVSVVSAAILAWQWYRRRRTTGVDDYLLACNKLELEALRASSNGQFAEAELRVCLAELAELKIDVLEMHQRGAFAGDPRFADLLTRIDSLQQTLPVLVLASRAVDAEPAGITPLRRKTA